MHTAKIPCFIVMTSANHHLQYLFEVQILVNYIINELKEGYIRETEWQENERIT
jgi:hypothetical protein